MAILPAVLATAILAGLGVALALMGIEEALLAGHDRAARALRLASQSAARLAVADLTSAPAWGAISALPSRFVETMPSPPRPWDPSPLDLAAETIRVQAETDAARGNGESPRTWRLFISGPFARAAPGSGCGPFYLLVWVADDGADTDGDPSVDSNGIVTVRADALGPDGGRASTLLSVMRTPVSGGPDAVRVLTIRPRL
jgi:hypothetical protein